jgi:hypothetical protein
MAVRKSRNRTHSGPDAGIDELERAAAGAEPVGHFGETKSNFMNENSNGAGSQCALAERIRARRP